MSLVRLAISYLHKFGFKRSLAATLIYVSRKLNSGVSVEEADKFALSQRPRKSIDRSLLDFDFTEGDLVANRELLFKWNKETHRRICSINWFLPDYHTIYAGGIFTIFRFLDFFSQNGILNRIIVLNGPYHRDSDSITAELKSAFPAIRNVEVMVNPKTIPFSDISIATFWATAYTLLKFNNTRGKYYFIQDYEPLFYPAGSWYGLAERTYTFGFLGITNGPTLKKLYEQRYKTQAQYFTPTADTKLFKPSPEAPRPAVRRIFFYARPAMDRNAFELGMLALEKIKAKYPKIEVVTAGWDLRDYELPFQSTNLGLLNLKQTAELYRTCDIGISFMFTKHPSYIPMELMASGCLVISNINQDNFWLLKHGYNCLLAEPTPSSILETFELAMKNYDVRKSIYENTLATVRAVSWEREMEKIYNFILGKDSDKGS